MEEWGIEEWGIEEWGMEKWEVVEWGIKEWELEEWELEEWEVVGCARGFIQVGWYRSSGKRYRAGFTIPPEFCSIATLLLLIYF